MLQFYYPPKVGEDSLIRKSIVGSSVPDPYDPYVFGPLGSVTSTVADPDPDPSLFSEKC